MHLYIRTVRITRKGGGKRGKEFAPTIMYHQMDYAARKLRELGEGDRGAVEDTDASQQSRILRYLPRAIVQPVIIVRSEQIRTCMSVIINKDCSKLLHD